MLRILSTQTQQWQGLLLTLYEHDFRGQELNVVFSCLSINYLSSDIVTRKLGLVMDALELAPHNVGQKNKRYDYVAGCLIAFACRESFKIEGDYKGFLTFVSKTNLIEWYAKKYGAELALGQRMFIDLEN